jgi:hypothetical protein
MLQLLKKGDAFEKDLSKMTELLTSVRKSYGEFWMKRELQKAMSVKNENKARRLQYDDILLKVDHLAIGSQGDEELRK